jgi:prolyl 3-hydroxylase /prolyl 3,4-dihydroxylase
MRDDLLRSVRSEILEHLHFTEKETDIYRIHQSGDLANLDGLDDSSLSKLPSLLTLRDALYSSIFRKYISEVANSSPLSGKKTDMAINVYTPGCHLLCHDDVIGSRRLSYILYLTDPDIPWKPEWGGALRLHPTEQMKSAEGVEATVPSPEFSASIPPAWNQLSFFTIQPGESFHDVEEVYRRRDDEDKNDGGRMRMAISGWFHIPQEGEEGYEEGLEEKLAEKSSLTQLQSKADQFDLPQVRWNIIQEPKSLVDGIMWTENELDFLLKFINPTYLVPDTLDELSQRFTDESVVTLPNFLNPTFALSLRKYISSIDGDKTTAIPARKEALSDEIGIARPPHKHRFLFRHSFPSDITVSSTGPTPLDQLLDGLLPSALFTRYLRYFTHLNFSQSTFLARRFRRSCDYTLATGYDEENPQLELMLGLTPTSGWGGENDEESNNRGVIPGSESYGGTISQSSTATNLSEVDEEINIGGYEVYMAVDDEEDEVDSNNAESSHTGAGQRRKADPAVYKASTNDEDDAVVFSMPASWNTLSIVLRDKGLLRFVKYVSKSARGDKWDIVGTYSVTPDEEGGYDQNMSEEDYTDDVDEGAEDESQD